MTETFVAMIALLVAILVSVGAAIGIVAGQAAWRVCRRDWAGQATDNTQNRA
jgi:hypothetical protein